MESEMKKIGILAFGDPEGGGVYQYTRSIIDTIMQNRDNVYIIFTDANNSNFDDYDIEIRKINKPSIFILNKLIRVFQILSLIRKPFFFTKSEKDIFFDIDKFICPVISLYPHFYLNKPFVFTLHDMQERYYPHFFTLRDKVIRWLNNRALSKSADKILCESKFVKGDIVKFLGVDPSIVHVVQSPPPKCFNSNSTDENLYDTIKKKYHLPEEYIFYPAQFWPHKNHIKLLEAFSIVQKEFENLKLVFTGSKQNNFQSVDNKIKELQLQNNVIYLGYIDYSDLPFLYKMSKFLVMPTLFESISIPIYEAFSLKVAVCYSDVVALPEQVGEAGLLFDPNNEKDIAKKMTMYLSNNKLLTEKAELGYLKINSFDYEAYKKSILEIINS
jgi:hypothetical protein